MQADTFASELNADMPPRVVEPAVKAVPRSLIEAIRRDPASSDVQRWADQIAAALDELPHGIALRLGEHAPDTASARHLAHRLAYALRDALVRRGAPAAMEVEVDAEQATQVLEHRRHRTLLPHHDGGNASFLTPSLLDDPFFSEHQRRTALDSVTTTRQHKLYQGFFLRAVGDFASITTYYDLLSILRSAYRHQTGVAPASIGALARWTGANLRRALGRIEALGGTYLTLGGMLGSGNPMHAVVAVHNADAAFSREQMARFPELQALSGSGHRDLSPSERLFDSVLREVLGEGWLSFRKRYEVGVEGVANDLLLGHNLTLLHGGWRGGRGRIIEPICFVLDDPSGDAYEQWLLQAWRRQTDVGPGGRS